MNSINRRDALKLGATASLAALAPAVSAGAPPAAAIKHDSVPQWEVFEALFAGPSAGNPFVDVRFSATFTQGNRSVEAHGFYDGNGAYKLRFMPDAMGEWSYRTESNAPELSGKTGAFACTAARADMHGPVRVGSSHHFAYADGTPFFPFGTTCYAWIHQSDELQKQTLESLRTGPFNKIRMCVFPKSYQYNHNEPAVYPFERDATGKSDFTKLNPAFFAHVEERIADLRKMNIEADLIVFHPYDRWGYAAMGAENDDRYLRYLVARLSAYRNIWWSMANEWDFMRAKSVQDFDRFFRIVQAEDPAGHLRSVHYGSVMYDYSRPWITHASLQTYAFDQTASWLTAWNKPICFDEVQYEGNLNSRWGNLSGEEMLWRFWLGVVAGAYVTHGETMLDSEKSFDESSNPTLWWAHGGKLHGTSPARIGFLRKIVEEAAAPGGVGAKRLGLDAAVPAGYYMNALAQDATGRAPGAILYFMDYHQPLYYDFPLPDGKWKAEMIDPWEMKVTPLDGTFTGKSRIKLAGRPYQALRFRKAT